MYGIFKCHLFYRCIIFLKALTEKVNPQEFKRFSSPNTLRVIATDLSCVQQIDRKQEKTFIAFYV